MKKYTLPTATYEETKSGKGKVSKEPLFIEVVEQYKGNSGVELSALLKLLDVKIQTLRLYARKNNIKYEIRNKGSTQFIFFK